MRSAAVILLGAGLLAGCSLAPRYRQPAAPIYPAYPDPGVDGTRQATELGWRDYFGDPRLKAYIAAALANNRDLAASVARIEQAHAQYRMQNAQRLPEVDFDSGASRAPNTTVTSGGSATSGSSATYNQYSASVGVSAFELDFWGRVRNLSVAARANYLATIDAERDFRLSLIGNVAATYLSLRAGEEQIALAERTLASRREGLGIAKVRFDAGVTSSIDYDQSYTLVTQAETELADNRRTTAQTENQLLVLVGGPMAGTLPSPRSVEDQGQFEPIGAGLPSALLTNRPDILQAEQKLRAADANIGAARAAFFPTISLTGNYGVASSALGNLFKGESRAWTFGGTLDLPILDWGHRTANLKLNKAQRDEAVANYQKTVQQAFREVSDGLVGRQYYAEQIKAQVDAVEAYRRLAEAAWLRYDNGISIYLEVLDAERNLFTAEQQLIILRSDALQNGVSLYIALGGGQVETVPPR
jgi:outer membrane protein, multidrug efflux system